MGGIEQFVIGELVAGNQSRRSCHYIRLVGLRLLCEIAEIPHPLHEGSY